LFFVIFLEQAEVRMNSAPLASPEALQLARPCSPDVLNAFQDLFYTPLTMVGWDDPNDNSAAKRLRLKADSYI
jgi:hypothetical protein